MRARIGMEVEGEVDCGYIIAMSREWCIYRCKKKASDGSHECAEPWESIRLVVEPPKKGEECSSLAVKDLPDGE
jgi:hypothetical protein